MKNKQIGNYIIQAMIGEGSFGKVYKGTHRHSKQEVALKFIARKGKSKKDMQALKQQIQILKKLKHENIIELKDYLQTPTEIILITEFAGKDLSAIMEKQKKFKVQQIKNYMRQIVSALLYLKQHRIVHRDLKPQNILIKQNIIKLCDFGFARKMSAATVCLYSLKGTPLYIAPEIISQKAYNYKIDIWSLGIILYQLYTGITPFYADTYYKLLPKILHDKIKYPKDISFELRELIDGMLQKNPNSRYDWCNIQQHPFLRKEQKPLQELSENNLLLRENQKSYLNFDQQFGIQSQLLKSSHLQKQNNKVEVEELRQYQQQIKKNPKSQLCTQLKTSYIFYHKMITLFSMVALGEKVGKEHLLIAFRVISTLITRVKLNESQNKEQDITKKKDLVITVIKLIGFTEEQDLLTHIYIMIGYLLKNNFDSVQLDLEAGEQIIDLTSTILNREKISTNLFVNILKIIGILANQAMMTLNISEQFFQIVSESNILEKISFKMEDQKQYSIVFQCLQKFLHPIKGEKAKNIKIFTKLKEDCAKGFTARGLTNFIKGVQEYTDLNFFLQVVYQCSKVSQQFRKSLLLLPSKQITSILNKNKLYNLAINYILIKEEKAFLCNLDAIRQQIIQNQWIQTQICKIYEIAIIFYSTNVCSNKPSKSKNELNKFIIKKISEMICLDQQVKTKSIESVEGWAYGSPSYTFDQVLIDLISRLIQQEKSFETDIMRSSMPALVKIFDNLIKIKNQQLNISLQSLYKLLPAIYNYIRDSNSNKKLGYQMIEAYHIILPEQSLMEIKSKHGDEFLSKFIRYFFVIIKQIALKQEKKILDLYVKCENHYNFHRIIFDEALLTEQILSFSLSFLYKIIQKAQPSTLDYIAVQGLPKIKKFFNSINNQIICDIVQVISYLARSKADYYSKISNIGIIEFMPKYLTLNIYSESLKQKCLNLIGNLSKHSTFFFDDFLKYKLITYIPYLISTSTNFEKLIKNVIYAVGNISFYNQQFREEIKPLIPYFYQALFIADDHLFTNNISTLSNLLRHSNSYLKDLINCNIFNKIFEIIEVTKNSNILLFSFGFLQKAVQYNEIFLTYPKQDIYKLVQKINPGPAQGELYKKFKKIIEKLK